MVKIGEKKFSLFSKIQAEGGKKAQSKLGVSKGIDVDSTLKVDGYRVLKYSALASQVAVKTLSTERANLLDLSPKYRRQEMDWQMFHVKHKNLSLLSELALTLKQKNALLKSQDKSLAEQVEPWNDKLARLSVEIQHKRAELLEEIKVEFKNLIERQSLNDIKNVSVCITSGFPKALNLESKQEIFRFLSQNLRKEQKFSQSIFGPQRGDLFFHQQDSPDKYAKDFFSRGQKKLISLYFSLAQVEALKKYGKKSVLCLDDVHSELDNQNFNRLIRLIFSQDLQCIVTAPIKSFVAMKKYGKTQQIKDGLVSEL